MPFDPSEPRDPHSGKWIKIVSGIKKLTAEDHAAVTKAIGEIPTGKHNRAVIKGVEVRKHLNGNVNVRLGGESRRYSSHEHAAHAVISKQHNEHGVATSSKKSVSPSKYAEKAGPKKNDNADWLYEKGLITAEEYKADTGKYPNENASKLQQKIPPTAPKKPYSETDASDIKIGDIIKSGVQHWKVEDAKTNVDGITRLQLINAQGVKQEKVLYKTDVVQKSNTPDLFKMASSNIGGGTLSSSATPPELPVGALYGPSAWSAVPEFKPPNYDVKGAIGQYTASGYIAVNQGLRKGLLNSEIAALVEKLDEAFRHSSPTTKEIVLFRGFSQSDSILGSPGSHLNGIFIDNGFISTSTNESTAKNFGGFGAMVHIVVPPGSRIVKPGSISSHHSENEIILNRGSKFKIISDKLAGGKRQIVLRLVP